MAKRLVNGRAELVSDSIEGTILGAGGQIGRLEYVNTVKVVVRTDAEFKKDKVAVICGGGSGHEPSHAGWVGQGMLSAAVCGDIFASPATESVLAAIQAVSGEKGCLVMLKNYTGDRLNFGLAVERAKGLGLQCDMVVVADDKAIKDAPQPRGIAGAIFAIKIAGYAAEQGLSLPEVKQAVEQALPGIASIGMALSVCTIPGAETSDRLDGNLVEYGLGIHGEPGRVKAPLSSSSEMVHTLVDQLLGGVKDKSVKFALIVNNLGSLPPLEMNIAVRDSVHALESQGVAIARIGVMTGMTSLDMSGFSLSLCDLAGTEEALVAPTTAISWVPLRPMVSEVVVLPCPVAPDAFDSGVQEGAAEPDSALGAILRKSIEAACEAVIKAEPELTKMDQIVGDGDCGETLKQGATRILEDLGKYPVNDAGRTLNALGHSAEQSMGGTSGILYSLGFSAAGACMLGGGSWMDALKAGTDAISRYGGATEGMRTMLDALYPATRSTGGAAEVASAAVAGANSTASMDVAGAGRSSYVTTDQLQGTADPGAVAVGVWLQALASSE